MYAQCISAANSKISTCYSMLNAAANTPQAPEPLQQHWCPAQPGPAPQILGALADVAVTVSHDRSQTCTVQCLYLKM